MNWPLVDPKDNGIRPAGKPDECFYCQSKVGEPHGRECVIVTKSVTLEYRILIDVEVPHFWNDDDINFHRNEGSWCAGNAVNELVCFKEELEARGECLCDRFVATPVAVARDRKSVV